MRNSSLASSPKSSTSRSTRSQPGSPSEAVIVSTFAYSKRGVGGGKHVQCALSPPSPHPSPFVTRPSSLFTCRAPQSCHHSATGDVHAADRHSELSRDLRCRQIVDCA